MEERKLLKRKRKALSEGNRNLLTSTCIDLAEIYFGKGDYNSAIDEYKEVAAIYKDMNKLLDYARANRMIGEAYTNLREYDRALHFQQIYLDVSKKENDKMEQQRAFATIGHTYLTSYLDVPNNPDKTSLNLAYKSFMRSLVICESLTGINKREHMDMSARLFANLGVVQECLGNFDKGIELIQKSINICKTHDIFEQLERGYSSIAALYGKKGDHGQAIHFYNLAIDVAGRLPEKASLMSLSLLAKSDILIKLSDFNSAKNVLLKAYKLKTPNKADFDQIEHNLKVVAAMCYIEDSLLTVADNNYKERKKLYEKMGDGACDLKNFTKALEYYHKMLDAAEKSGDDLSPCYISLAQTYNDNKQYNLAIEYFQKDYELCKHDKGRNNLKETIGTLYSIADATELAGRDIKEIEKVYNEAMKVCRNENNVKLLGRTIKRFITILKKHNRMADIERLKFELINVDYNSSGSESEESEEQNTPNIGDDVCVDDITDLSENSENESDLSKPRSTRKRTKGFVIKRNNKGETQLHTACINGNVTLVQKLLHQGHVVNIRDHCGWLPIHEACICGHVEIVKMLLDKGASINDRGGTLCNGITPLHDAASNGHLEVIQLLLDRGASAVAKTDDGETPLHILRKWRASEQLSSENSNLYEIIVERMSRILEKSGQDYTSVVTKQNPSLIASESTSTGRTKRAGSSNSQARRLDRYSNSIEKTTINNQVPRSSSKSPIKKPTEYKTLRRNALDESDSDEELFPKRPTNYGSDSHSHSDSHSDSDSNSSNNSDFDSNSSKKKSDKGSRAGEHYREVIESLRKRPNEEPAKKKKSLETKKPALVTSEDVGDDWLEDDLNINNSKKRKSVNSGEFFNTRGIKRKPSDLISSSSDRATPTKSTLLSRHSSSSSLQDEVFRNAFDSDFNEEIINLINEEEKTIPGSSHRKKQSSLLNAGFTRRKSFSPTNFGPSGSSQPIKRKHQSKITKFGCNDVVEADSTTERSDNFRKNEKHSRSPFTQGISATQTIPASQVDITLSVDVRIAGKLHRVPILQSELQTKDIKWLASEASRRYSRKECIKPVLELETINGASLADDDPISILFRFGDLQPEEVVAKVIKWDIPSLSERYKETCNLMTVDTNEAISKILMESTTCIDLSNLVLRKSAAPLCKALMRQINLLNLNLSGNYIGNDSIELLCASLPSLENLTSLDLSSNNLSSASLNYLCDMFSATDKSILEHLEDLNLSHNPLGDESLKHLAVITRYLNLKTLNLMDVDLTKNVFTRGNEKNLELVLNKLRNFNLSYNNLEKEQLSRFISWLNGGELETLDVSHNRDVAEGLTTIIVQLLENNDLDGRKFQMLNLSRCGVSDSEIYNMLRVLSYSNTIQNLDLSYNPNLTAISLRRLIQHSSLIARLNLFGCDNILKYFEECTGATWSFAEDTNKLKYLSLSIDTEKNKQESDALTNMWLKQFGEKSNIIIMKDYVEMSVRD